MRPAQNRWNRSDRSDSAPTTQKVAEVVPPLFGCQFDAPYPPFALPALGSAPPGSRSLANLGILRGSSDSQAPQRLSFWKRRHNPLTPLCRNDLARVLSFSCLGKRLSDWLDRELSQFARHHRGSRCIVFERPSFGRSSGSRPISADRPSATGHPRTDAETLRVGSEVPMGAGRRIPWADGGQRPAAHRIRISGPFTRS